MKIAYCISGTFNSGGMERIVTQKSNWLVNHGYDVTIITVEQKGRQPFYHIDEKIKTVDLDINYWEHKTMSVWKKLKSLPQKKKLHKKRLKDILNQINPDIIISTFGHEFDFLHKIKGHSKIIAELHFQRYFMIKANRTRINKIVDYYRTYTRDFKLRHYDRVIILTNEDYQEWPLKGNISVIPNFTNTPSLISTHTNKNAIAVGRLSYPKNFSILIKVWGKVCERNSDWILNIYGDGEERETLNHQIREAGLESRINLNPASKTIEKEYLNSSIFLMTSRHEGFSLVLCEAMSYGLAPVAFACKCGPKDIIENEKSGYLIEPDNIESMANRILELINNDDKRLQMGMNAHNRIKSAFSQDIVMAQWTTLFDTLIKGKQI